MMSFQEFMAEPFSHSPDQTMGFPGIFGFESSLTGEASGPKFFHPWRGKKKRKLSLQSLGFLRSTWIVPECT
jgi:hypothetical protein